MKSLRNLSRLSSLLFLAILLSSPIPTVAQSDISDEIALGLRYRSSVLSNAAEIRGTKEDILAQSVFRRLISTSVGVYAPPLPYSVTIINDSSINAFATSGGQVFIPFGMAKLLGDDKGLWAAVLGHEIAHNVGRHHYKSFLREVNYQRQVAYYRKRIEEGDKNASWALVGLQIGAGIAEKKFSRDDEHEADSIGLRMMVEAGYHPAFAITLYRRLRLRLGDDSKFAAFFSTHPRWATREERANKNYEDAVARFESLWPDAARSPGGNPPIILDIGKVRPIEDKKDKVLLIQVPFHVRNGKETPLEAVVIFFHKGKRVESGLSEFQNSDGNLIGFTTTVPQSKDQTSSATIKVPTAALVGKNRKMKAVVLFHRNGELLDYTKEFNVTFPKQ